LFRNFQLNATRGNNNVMTPYVTFLVFSLALLGEGCASRPALVITEIGPAPNPPGTIKSDGTLVVFSEFDVHAHFNDLPYRRFYSDYNIYSEDGTLLQKVHNTTRPLGDPKEVQLAPGNYKIKARANGNGLVTVPLKIVAYRMTTVHLEGGIASGE
jgi:hypothetical protein